MKRLYIGSFLLGFGFITLGTFLSLFFEDVYGFSPFHARASPPSSPAPAPLLGLMSASGSARRRWRPGEPSALATITGLAFTAGAVGLVLMAITPWAAGSLLFSVACVRRLPRVPPRLLPRSSRS